MTDLNPAIGVLFAAPVGGALRLAILRAAGQALAPQAQALVDAIDAALGGN